jgi:hypothetical protein
MDDEAEQQHWAESMAAQQALMRMSDRPWEWRDPMGPFKDLLKAQRQAISGESDGGFSAMSVPF